MPVITCRFVCTWKSRARRVADRGTGAPSRNTRYVFSVCIVRFPGASTFGWPGSSEKPRIRLFMMMPVPGIATAGPQLREDALDERAHIARAVRHDERCRVRRRRRHDGAARACSGSIAARRSGRPLLRQQPRRIEVHKRRVAREPLPVLERQLLRLDHVVHRVRRQVRPLRARSYPSRIASSSSRIRPCEFGGVSYTVWPRYSTDSGSSTSARCDARSSAVMQPPVVPHAARDAFARARPRRTPRVRAAAMPSITSRERRLPEHLAERAAVARRRTALPCIVAYFVNSPRALVESQRQLRVTREPSRAYPTAGATRSARGIVHQRSWNDLPRVDQPRDRRRRAAVLRDAVAIAAPASRPPAPCRPSRSPSRALRAFGYARMYASPPRWLRCGFTTGSSADIASAASKALPPRAARRCPFARPAGALTPPSRACRAPAPASAECSLRQAWRPLRCHPRYAQRR